MVWANISRLGPRRKWLLPVDWKEIAEVATWAKIPVPHHGIGLRVHVWIHDGMIVARIERQRIGVYEAGFLQ